MALAIREVHEGFVSHDGSDGEDQWQLQGHQPQQQQEQEGHERHQEKEQGEYVKGSKLSPSRSVQPWETQEGLMQGLKEVVLVLWDLIAIVTEL